MAKRVSALAAQKPQLIGANSSADAGVILSVIKEPLLYQIAAWPDTLTAVAESAAALAGVAAPGPCTAAVGTGGTLLRVEPLRWWWLRESSDKHAPPLPSLTAAQGTVLDLSHSRTWVRLDGAEAAALLTRFLALDLRAAAFPIGSVASTAFHHVGVTLWHSADGYQLLLPRGFALSLWELLLEGGEQFGVEVR